MLDLIVPPLSLFLIILIITATAAGLALLAGAAAAAFVISLGCLGVVSLATVAAWILHGRDVLPLRSLVLVPLYLMTKVRHYVSAALGDRISQWVRADRG